MNKNIFYGLLLVATISKNVQKLLYIILLTVLNLKSHLLKKLI